MTQSPSDAVQVLVVDDEVPFASVVASYLRRERMQVQVAHSGSDAVEMARECQPDLVVLDIMLPGFDGVEVCRQLRTFTDAYVIMLTARDTETDKVVALSVGADDYLVKPFRPRELVARAKAMLRRPRSLATPTTMRVGALVIDESARRITWHGQHVELTRTEFDILNTLAKQPEAAFSRHDILTDVWGRDWFGDEHVVDVHVGHIRHKLGNDAIIRTVRGVGYALEPSAA
ncbi:MAG: response regulator transcription factor [Actinobacteria bacterium]|nr:response regulator transcription factor [Actinomycetota bacterium]